MISINIGKYATIGILSTVLAGCQSQPSNKHAYPVSRSQARSQSQSKSVRMTQHACKFDGMVGNVQYNAFELESVEYAIAPEGIAGSISIVGHDFCVVGSNMEQVIAGITLTHEASLGKNLDESGDAAAFSSRLDELLAFHKDTIGEPIIASKGGMWGNPATVFK